MRVKVDLPCAEARSITSKAEAGTNVNVRAAAGNGAARKPTRAVPVSRERAKQRREEAERSERQRRAQEEEDRTRQVEHKRKTAEMAERGRARVQKTFIIMHINTLVLENILP